MRDRTAGLAVGLGRHRPNRIGFVVEVRMDLKPFKAFLASRHRIGMVFVLNRAMRCFVAF